MPERKLIATLRALHDGGVEFILVGGLAAVLHGAPVHTFDIDIVHSRERANVDRLLPVLEDLDAVFRMQPPHFARASVELDIGQSLLIRVLDLETLIALKEELAGEKDRAVLPILRRTLEEKKKR